RSAPGSRITDECKIQNANCKRQNGTSDVAAGQGGCSCQHSTSFVVLETGEDYNVGISARSLSEKWLYALPRPRQLTYKLTTNMSMGFRPYFSDRLLTGPSDAGGSDSPCGEVGCGRLSRAVCLSSRFLSLSRSDVRKRKRP